MKAAGAGKAFDSALKQKRLRVCARSETQSLGEKAKEGIPTLALLKTLTSVLSNGFKADI